jgi:hypothetical protein
VLHLSLMPHHQRVEHSQEHLHRLLRIARCDALFAVHAQLRHIE